MFSSFEISVHILFLVLKTTPTNTKDCKQGYFGAHCELRCHCRGGDTNCHGGKCKHGCAGSYIGPKCQFLGHLPVAGETKGAALYDNSSQTCLGKAVGKRVRIELRDAAVMTWIRFVFKKKTAPLTYQPRTEDNRVAGCTRKESHFPRFDTTEMGCFTIKPVKHVHIWGSYLGTLCTFIYSTDCKLGYWGEVCRTRCHRVCIGGCDKHSGECRQYPCAAGLKGTDCKEACDEGHYGLGCLLSCSPNCVDGKCNHVDGTCERGCTPGYTGSNCTKECGTGTYGKDCSHRCSSHCKSGRLCLTSDGACLHGCEPGYQLPDCQKECGAYEFGQHCAFTCSLHCAGQLCDHVTGNCLSCPPGALGPRCNQACPSGKFGQNCNDSCPVHCPDLCDGATGHCVHCETAGEAGPTCDQDCPSGRYGLGCRHYCTTHCHGGWASCHPVDGTCKQGCASHFKPPFCTVCLESHHGEDCSTPCSRNCQGGKCHPDTGACLNCPKGRRGETCSAECLPGYHGHNCEERCNEGCFERVCDMVTGHCRDCILGREGKYCQNEEVNDDSALKSQGGGALGPLLFVLAMVMLVTFLIFGAKVQREEQRKRALLFRQRGSSSSGEEDASTGENETESQVDHKAEAADTLGDVDGFQKRLHHLKPPDTRVSLASKSDSSSSGGKRHSKSKASSRISRASSVDPEDARKFSQTYKDGASEKSSSSDSNT